LFWKGQFDSVWIDFEGEENLEALKRELFERFGKPPEPEAKMDKMGRRPPRKGSPTEPLGPFYTWWGKNTEIWLSYSRERHKGTLTMNSRRISEERRAYEKERKKEERLRERGF
jgi:8-oxo-dGTP pyrophosphatase MutT (NUDIX family)